MYQITNKDRDELLNLLNIQINDFRSLTKERKLTGRESIIFSKAKYLAHRLDVLRKLITSKSGN